MHRRVIALAFALVVGGHATEPGIAQAWSAPTSRVLLVNQVNRGYPEASETRGQQVLMLLRHFDPTAEIVADDEYRRGTARPFDRVVVLGNDAVTPLAEMVLQDLRARQGPMMWVGYGLGHLSADPDKDLGFAPGFVESGLQTVEIAYRGDRLATTLDERHQVRIASPDTNVLASILGSGDPMPLAVRHGEFWFFGGLPSLDSDYPDPAIDTLTLVFADLLSDFFSVAEHQPHQAVLRLEDVSVHVPPERVIDAVDALATRGVPFVVGVIPAQQMPDGSVISLQDHPEFVQALRYAQDRGGTIALHGYHHTFGQGEDFEFWDPERHAPPAGETWEAYALKVEDGIRALREEGLEPMLWETPHYAASPLGYRVFGSYFSHAIENRDPATWLPYAAGPDPSGQVLIPENLGYINEEQGLTVEDQLARAQLLQIVRDAVAVGFYHPASIPVSDLERLADGLAGLGYRFADVRTLPLSVDVIDEPSLLDRVATAVRIEPGLTILGLRRAIPSVVAATGDVVSNASSMMPFLVICIFLWRLRAQWHSAETGQASRVESAALPARDRVRFAVLIPAALVVFGFVRLAALAPIPPREIALVPAERVEHPEAVAIESSGWELSTYFTAVEQYYAGPEVALRGCPTIDCENGSTFLGTFSEDFLEAVKAEGSGRLDSPALGQSHLNWSIDTGYWLDSAPRDARGSVLEPFLSAAADPEIPYVSTFRIGECGVDVVSGHALVASGCEDIQARDWIVRDRFTVGHVGKHLDLYVGEQNRPDFLDRSPLAIHTTGGSVNLARYDTTLWAS